MMVNFIRFFEPGNVLPLSEVEINYWEKVPQNKTETVGGEP